MFGVRCESLEVVSISATARLVVPGKRLRTEFWGGISGNQSRGCEATQVSGRAMRRQGAKNRASSVGRASYDPHQLQTTVGD